MSVWHEAPTQTSSTKHNHCGNSLSSNDNYMKTAHEYLSVFLSDITLKYINVEDTLEHDSYTFLLCKKLHNHNLPPSNYSTHNPINVLTPSGSDPVLSSTQCFSQKGCLKFLSASLAFLAWCSLQFNPLQQMMHTGWRPLTSPLQLKNQSSGSHSNVSIFPHLCLILSAKKWSVLCSHKCYPTQKCTNSPLFLEVSN